MTLEECLVVLGEMLRDHGNVEVYVNTTKNGMDFVPEPLARKHIEFMCIDHTWVLFLG